ncbi:S41 family peptidase [Seonamhaeicola maritimus]|uniref:Tricorn protease homolog n=1 Tax=Seonamhaeicola maritimus TaxID=2591822 RepID=A0A5C7GEZ1_9FLAO|nr:S41 family peptidase [Seonamhaeicola maritimus]TXG35632.1 peptidase S41 [Seonamhaeicola maritimus]
MKKILSLITLLFVLTSFSQNNPLWLRYPSISPDGNTILFNYKGDIYKVPSSGGMAVPMTLSDSYEFNPVWSHDGKQIAFASNRYGNFDVFVMSSIGGEAKRLTYHSNNEVPSDFSTDNKNILFSGLRQDLHTNVQFPSGVMAELYSVPASGGRVMLELTSPAHNATYSSDGKTIIFHDRKGYENDWRKHHTSAVTRDIWSYNLENKSYKQLSSFNGEDRNPIFDSNNIDFYYLSEETGAFNVHKSSIENPNQNEALTSFSKHPVRFLSSSDNNTLCFSFDGEIYTMAPNNAPQKVSIELNYDGRSTLEKIVPVNSNFTETHLSSNGKEVAYVFRGEIFVSNIENGSTKRITNTPYQERSVSFSPDGKSLVYAAEVNNSWGIYETSIVREDEPYFYASTLLKEKVIIQTGKEEFQPLYAPNGKEIAYLEDRTTIKVINLESKNTRTVVPAKHNYSYADGDMWFQWSPDSKWLLFQFGQEESIMQEEVGLTKASGKGEIRNLTQSGYFDFAPKWSSDGKMMTWVSTRQSAKMENGRPNEIDVFAMFFSKEAFDRFNLSKADFDLLKDIEKKEDDKGDQDKSNTSSKKKAKNKADVAKSNDTKDLIFDWNHMRDRKLRLTTHTSRISDWLLSKEGDKLYYLSRFEGKNDLWVSELRKKENKLFAKLGVGNAKMILSKDDKFILLIADGKLKKVNISDAKVKSINTKGEMVLKQSEERNYIFNHSWRQLRDKFYVEDLQGVDWAFYYDEYKKFLPHINNNYDFAEMLSEMLGEMNASHTGSGYRFNNPNGDQTSSLGILYDYSHSETGVKVAEVLIGGPMDKAASKVRAGHIIEKIDGQKLSVNLDFYQLLNRKKDKYVLLSIFDPSKNTRWEEVVKPISLGAENQMLYKRWVKSRRAEVSRLSGGKLGYVHVRGMNDPSMRVVIEDALGKHLSSDALVVDTRFNGGGNLHDILSDFLNGKKYMEIIPHGQYVGHQPRSLWVKPSIVVMGESNYSDAHLFPVAYKIKGIGKTLGMPVPGTGTFVWWETQIDPTIYFGIPMGGWRPIGEPFLENNQLEPDIKVHNEPGIMAIGRDQQIEEAVKTLLKN